MAFFGDQITRHVPVQLHYVYFQKRKRSGVNHADTLHTDPQAPGAGEGQNELEGVEQQQLPPVRHMVCSHLFVVLILTEEIFSLLIC